MTGTNGAISDLSLSNVSNVKNDKSDYYSYIYIVSKNLCLIVYMDE